MVIDTDLQTNLDDSGTCLCYRGIGRCRGLWIASDMYIFISSATNIELVSIHPNDPVLCLILEQFLYAKPPDLSVNCTLERCQVRQ